jgi:hypothetical protein
MQNAHVTRMVKRIRQSANDSGDGRRVHAMVVAIPPQGPAADELVGNPAATLVKSRIMHRHDVGVIQPRRRARLAEKTFHHPIARILLLEDLDRHVPVESRVVRPIHLAKAAIPQPLAQLKSPQRTE